MNQLYQQRNLTMLADFYEFTMANGYLESGAGDCDVVFDLFFRRVPEAGGFAICAGLEQVIQYLQNLRFTQEDLDYFRSRGCFGERFLQYLRDFRFSCDVWAIPEGTPIFPNEPVITVRGPLIQAQLVETMQIGRASWRERVCTDV